ncbi:MAG: M20 family peptidase [Bacteroidia bacterium]
MLLLFIAWLAGNTFTFQSKQIQYDPVVAIEINSASTVNFSHAIQIRTVSPENPADFDSTQFYQFAAFLKTTYPLADSLLEKKVFNTFSYLYKWEGADLTLKPIVLMAHLDVVPVLSENIPHWKHDPFGGNIVNDTIWGRGAIDDKIGVIGIMETVERLLSEGYQPKRTIYLSLGHDEEIGGTNGAKTIAAFLLEQAVEAEFVIDEGGTISQGLVPGLEKDVALIGIAEKGILTLELSVEIEGGHSSMPEKETAIDVLSAAIARVKENPLPAKITPPIDAFIEALGPEMPFLNKLAFANKGVFRSMIIGAYEKSASGNALVRTTTSPTIFNSGVKENVIPRSAKAIVNFRVLPETTFEEVEAFIRKVVNDDRISITAVKTRSEPSAVSSVSSLGYQTLARSIAEVYPETLISPYLVVGATDSRHFKDISADIYRFSPIKINRGNIKSFHGLNERLAVAELENALRFYYQLIKNGASE